MPRKISPTLMQETRYFWQCPNCDEKVEVYKTLCGKPRQDIRCDCGSSVQCVWVSGSETADGMGYYEYLYAGPEEIFRGFAKANRE